MLRAPHRHRLAGALLLAGVLVGLPAAATAEGGGAEEPDPASSGRLPVAAPPGAPLQVADTVPVPDIARRREALEAADPLLPRGSILLQVEPANTNIRGLHRDGARPPLGEGFHLPELGVEQLPALAPTQARFRELAENGSNWTLNLGRAAGRIEADEQVIPVRLGYGLLDRVTVGVTVPFVRRRIASTLTAGGAGATAGANPLLTDPEAVDAFLAGAAGALQDLQALVDEACAEPPDEEDPAPLQLPSCAAGEDLLARASGFIEQLAAAYDEEAVFPLRGSAGAAGIGTRWDGFRGELSAWEVASPERVPVAEAPVSDAAFQALLLDPAWGAGGFPREPAEELMEVGDVEAHLVLGLLRTGVEGEGFRLRSSVVGTLRLPTGVADTLQAIVPFAPPKGVTAVGVRLVADAISPARLGVLAVAEGWWHGETETVILAPDPARLLGEGAVARAAAVWQPGAAFRLRIVPRVHLTPSLSLGLGYQADHREPHRIDFLDLPGVTPIGSADASRVHRIRGEFRYHGFEDPVAEALPFPLELVLGWEGTFAGTGPLAPRERRIEIGMRVLRGR
jgi:hypothetical protein